MTQKTPAEIEKWFSKWLQKKLTGRAIIELKEIIELRRKEAEITQTGRVPKAPLNSEVAGSNPALCNNQKKESENGQLENKRSEEYGEALSRIDDATKKTPAEIEKNKKLIGVNYKTKNGKLVADEIYSDGSIREVNVNNGIVNYILEGETSAPELEEMTGNSNLSSEEEIIEMEIIEREAKKFGGNASHVILPTKYNGKKVQIKILNQKALSLQRQKLASLQEKIEKRFNKKLEELNMCDKYSPSIIGKKRMIEDLRKELQKIFKEMGQ